MSHKSRIKTVKDNHSIIFFKKVNRINPKKGNCGAPACVKHAGPREAHIRELRQEYKDYLYWSGVPICLPQLAQNFACCGLEAPHWHNFMPAAGAGRGSLGKRPFVFNDLRHRGRSAPGRKKCRAPAASEARLGGRCGISQRAASSVVGASGRTRSVPGRPRQPSACRRESSTRASAPVRTAGRTPKNPPRCRIPEPPHFSQ